MEEKSRMRRWKRRVRKGREMRRKESPRRDGQKQVSNSNSNRPPTEEEELERSGHHHDHYCGISHRQRQQWMIIHIF